MTLCPPTAKVLKGNVLNVLPELPDASVHAVVTSPPYWGHRVYNVPETMWPAVSFRPIAMDGVAPVEVPEWYGCLGLEPTSALYVAHIVAVFREVRRVLREDGTLWLNLGDTSASARNSNRRAQDQGKQKGHALGRPDLMPHRGGLEEGLKSKDLCGMPYRVALALQADGWTLRQEIIWHKPNALPESVKDRPARDFEPVFLFAQARRYFYDAFAVREAYKQSPRKPGAGSMQNQVRPRGQLQGDEVDRFYGAGSRGLRTLWSIATRPNGFGHIAAFPPELPRRCILLSTSDFGVCEFCGAPYRRLVRRQRMKDGQPIGQGKSYRSQSKSAPSSAQGDGHWRYSTRVEHQGWQEGCECQAPRSRALVLDPFCGSGTTGIEAVNHGRSFVGIEADESSFELSRDRLRTQQLPLLEAGS